MIDIYTILKSAGLSPSERTVYLLGLRIGNATTRQFEKTSGLPRPTLLAALKNLSDSGLCAVKAIDGKSNSYEMLPIGAVKQLLGRRAREIETLIDEVSRYEVTAEELIVHHSRGQTELINLLEMALYCKERSWKVIAPKNNPISHLPKQAVEHFKHVRSERQISTQTIWEAKFSDQTIDLVQVLMRKPRYVPESIAGDIPALLLSFDDKIIISQGTTNPQNALLTSRATTTTFNILFEIAWRSIR